MIQKATLSQLPRILELYQSAREFMAANGNPTQWGDNFPPEDMILEDIRQGKCHVLMEEGAILAVFYFAVEQDPDYGYIEGAWCNDKPYGVIHRIAVDARGRGAAAKCFSYALECCDELRIDTHRDNLPMRKCLAKNGFIQCGTIYLQDGDSRIAYQRSK